MSEVSFVIPGRVKGKGRPRAVARGGFARVYTPKDTVNAESMVRKFAAEILRARVDARLGSRFVVGG